MTFIWPLMLLSLLLLPALIGLYFRLLRRRRLAVAELGPLGLVNRDLGREPGLRRHVSPTLFLLGLALLLVGTARPEMEVSLPRIEGTVILAFDLSNSMVADDIEPTRIEAAKSAARAFVANQPPTILIGVVAFSRGGLVVQKPTNDKAAIDAAIERLSPQGGTSLGQGIFSSLNAIAGEAITIDETALDSDAPPIEIGDFSSAVILLLTDGENTSPPDPLEVAQVAAEAGVRIYPVGLGSPEGAVLQIDGYSIVSQLNEPALREIASLTNGFYYHAGDEQSLTEIYESVDLQMTIKGEKTEVTGVLAGISMLFFGLGGALSLWWFGRGP